MVYLRYDFCERISSALLSVKTNDVIILMLKYISKVQNDSADLERMMAYMQIQQWMQEMKYNKGDYNELRDSFSLLPSLLI